MFLKKKIEESMKPYSHKIQLIKQLISQAEAIVIGAGSGLSTSAGLTYSGERFETLFSDFIEKYPIPDMYTGGFWPYETLEEYWAWWSRHIYYNRYIEPPKPVYKTLLGLVQDKNYFVITTNVDHCFQKAGFDKTRLFYMQGDYGLWQCSLPCHQKTYDNEVIVSQMIEQQKEMKIPSELIPLCPVCGKPMTMNLRSDETFVQDEGWYQAQKRYEDFLEQNESSRVIYLELGVGNNTPVWIKYPFWDRTAYNPNATYICLNNEEAYIPPEIKKQSIMIKGDIGQILDDILD